MTITNAVKKLGTFGTVSAEECGEWRATKGGYEVSFLRNGHGDQVTCFRTRRVTDQDDSQTDYFAGSFWPNMTQAIAHANRMIEQDARERGASARVLAFRPAEVA
jgi:hypothetical protein